MTMHEGGVRVPMLPGGYADICDTVERICTEYPGKYWRDLEDRPTGQRFPTEFMGALSEAGILAAPVPEAYGGLGLPAAALVAIVETIHASGCNGTALIAHFELSQLVATAALEDLKQAVFLRIAEQGAMILSLAQPDGDGGSGPTTQPQPDGGVVVTGGSTRVFAPDHSTYIVIVGQDAETRTLLLAELPPLLGKTVLIEPVRELTASNVADVRFDTLALQGSSRIGGENTGAAPLEQASVLRRILEAAASIGDGRFFCGRGTKYAGERVVFGRPIGAYQGIQFPLARSYIEVEAASIALGKAVALYDVGADAAPAASVARYLATEASWAMADAAFTTHGGFAFAREYDIERKWRDVRAAKAIRSVGHSDLVTIGAARLGFHHSLPRS